MPYVYEDSVLNPSADNSASDLVGPYFLDRATARTSDVLREQFAMAFEENPIEAIRRWHALSEDAKRGKYLTKPEADQRLGDVGLTGKININDHGISDEALKTLIFRKQVELQRQETFARSRGGVAEGAARFGIAFGTSLSDPLNVGLSFVPVVGQAKYLKWLQLAKTPLARAGVRAGVGAIEGAAGAAIVEPFIYGSRRAEQADYDSVDSLLNVAFGTALGAGLHTTVGGIADVVGRFRRAAEAPPSVKPEPSVPPSTPSDGVAPILPEVTPRAREWRVENIDQMSPGEIQAQLDRVEALMNQPENLTGDRAVALDYLARALNDEDLTRFVVRNESGDIVAAASFGVEEGVAYGENLGSIEAGAARKLIKELKAKAEEMGISSVQFEARPGSEKFHERMGFREENGIHQLELGEDRQGHIDRTREAVSQAVTGERVDVIPKDRVVAFPTRGIEPRIVMEGKLENESWRDYAIRQLKDQMDMDERAAGELYDAARAGDDELTDEQVAASILDEMEILPESSMRGDFESGRKEIADEWKSSLKEATHSKPQLSIVKPKGRQHGESWFDFATRTAAEQGFDDTKLLREVYQANLREGMSQKEAALGALEELGLDTESAAPNTPWSDETVGPDPEVAESIRAAEETSKEVDTDPVEALDEDLANAESDLAEVEKRYGIEEPDEDLEEFEEAITKAAKWSKAAEVATDCLLRGV